MLTGIGWGKIIKEQVKHIFPFFLKPEVFPFQLSTGDFATSTINDFIFCIVTPVVFSSSLSLPPLPSTLLFHFLFFPFLKVLKGTTLGEDRLMFSVFNILIALPGVYLTASLWWKGEENFKAFLLKILINHAQEGFT